MHFSTKSCIKGLLSALVVSAQSDLDKKVFCVNQDAKVDRVDLNDGLCSFRLPSNYSTSFHYRNDNDYEVTFYYATLGNKVYLTDIEDQDNVIYIPARDLYEKDDVVIYGVSRSNGSENVTRSSDMVIMYVGDDSEYDERFNQTDHEDDYNQTDHEDYNNQTDHEDDYNQTNNDYDWDDGRDDNVTDNEDNYDNDRVTDKEDNDDTFSDNEDHRRSLHKRDNDAFIHHLILQQGEQLQRGIFRVAAIDSGSISSSSGFTTMTTSSSLSTTMSSTDSASSSTLKSSSASPSDSLTAKSSTSTDSSSSSTSTSTSSSSTSTGTAIAEDSASISSVSMMALVLFSIVGLM